MRLIVSAALLAAMFSGCGNAGPVDRVTYVKDDDPKMNAAMEKARSTVQTFITALKAPKAGQTGFAIKKGFKDGDKGEHMWVSPVIFDGANFKGKINNDPQIVTNVKNGQAVTIAPDEISDWMFIDGRKLVGGETLRVLRDTLPVEERAAFDKSVPFVIE
ncbi:MAG: DUF2314 domain-containing protein [Planctomycetaceae bacterium]|nr:DUF2314 domain-containing protein [Planctomycetaceae bacterium]